MKGYVSHHYVPQWYQKNFIPKGKNKIYYLDLTPDMIKDSFGKPVMKEGKYLYRENLLHWGPKRCFCIDHLYSVVINGQKSSDVEKIFFGRIDDRGKKAVEYFKCFSHPSVEPEFLDDFLSYLSTQKLRTPKGLSDFKGKVNVSSNNELMSKLQIYKNIHCAIWQESVWAICETKGDDIGFLLSDHPVTVYNQGAFPSSSHCIGDSDPLITQLATHTLFPLSYNKILIITNLSWARNPYQKPLKLRPNPKMMRDSFFNFLSVQTGRVLDEDEVIRINYIIKKRAKRYLAAHDKTWLYPESKIKNIRWDKISENHFLMPEPRVMQFSAGVVFGKENGNFESFDMYGRKLRSSKISLHHEDVEYLAFQTFQAEYARIWGAYMRGKNFEGCRISKTMDEIKHHKERVKTESYFKNRLREMKKEH